MLHKIIIVILFMLTISACSQIATPLPLQTARASVRPTRTLSSQEKTEAASYDAPTLPASFTPTFTPSVTSTPTVTATPTATFTPTAIPEEILCEEFSIGYAAQAVFARDELEDVIQVYLPYSHITISGEVRNLTTDEIVDEGVLQGGQSWTLDFTPAIFPDIASYEWVFTLNDATRTGMCELRGTFETSAEELASPTPEMTAEVTAESTAEITAEMTADAPEMTEEATATPQIFPPR